MSVAVEVGAAATSIMLARQLFQVRSPTQPAQLPEDIARAGWPLLCAAPGALLRKLRSQPSQDRQETWCLMAVVKDDVQQSFSSAWSRACDHQNQSWISLFAPREGCAPAHGADAALHIQAKAVILAQAGVPQPPVVGWVPEHLLHSADSAALASAAQATRSPVHMPADKLNQLLGNLPLLADQDQGSRAVSPRRLAHLLGNVAPPPSPTLVPASPKPLIKSVSVGSDIPAFVAEGWLSVGIPDSRAVLLIPGEAARQSGCSPLLVHPTRGIVPMANSPARQRAPHAESVQQLPPPAAVGVTVPGLAGRPTNSQPKSKIISVSRRPPPPRRTESSAASMPSAASALQFQVRDRPSSRSAAELPSPEAAAPPAQPGSTASPARGSSPKRTTPSLVIDTQESACQPGPGETPSPGSGASSAGLGSALAAASITMMKSPGRAAPGPPAPLPGDLTEGRALHSSYVYVASSTPQRAAPPVPLANTWRQGDHAATPMRTPLRIIQYSSTPGVPRATPSATPRSPQVRVVGVRTTSRAAMSQAPSSASHVGAVSGMRTVGDRILLTPTGLHVR